MYFGFNSFKFDFNCSNGFSQTILQMELNGFFQICFNILDFDELLNKIMILNCLNFSLISNIGFPFIGTSGFGNIFVNGKVLFLPPAVITTMLFVNFFYFLVLKSYFYEVYQ